MIDLLMLGIIPGTNIQITFANWLLVSTALSICVCLAFLIRYRQQLALLTMRLARTIWRSVLLAAVRIQLARELRKTATVL